MYPVSLWISCFAGCCRSYSRSARRILPARTSCLKGKDSDMMPWAYLQVATSVERLGQCATGKIKRGLLNQSFTARKWMAELVLVLALFEKVLQQLFDLLFMVHFSFSKRTLSTVSCGINRKRRRFRKDRGKILISCQESGVKCLDWARDAFQQQRGDRQSGTQDEDS